METEQDDPITGLPYYVNETTGEWTPAYSGKAEAELQAEIEASKLQAEIEASKSE